MSVVAIRQALETRLDLLTPQIPTAWENVEYSASSGTPFQRAYLLPGNNESPVFGSTELVRELGLFQISLYYPIGRGMKDVSERAELIRAWFPRGLTLVSGGVNVIIQKRASVAPANRDGEWTVLPLSIPYFANVFV